MAEPVIIVIAGEPVAAPRPRFRNIHKRDGSSFTSTYMPSEFTKWGTQVRYIAQQAMDGRAPMQGPLTMDMRIFLPMPSAVSKIKRAAMLNGNIWPTKRPDLDNYIKAFDCLNNLVWVDDSQIVYIVASKHYSDRPRIELEIREMEASAVKAVPDSSQRELL